MKNILKKGLRFPKHRAIIHFAADTRELMRRCRTTASTSAFQAEDVGSTPITCSTKQARGKSSGLLAATTAYADVAELADALDSGSSGSDTVGVQVPSSAPKSRAFGIFPFRQSKPRSFDRGFFVCLPAGSTLEKIEQERSGHRQKGRSFRVFSSARPGWSAQRQRCTARKHKINKAPG